MGATRETWTGASTASTVVKTQIVANEDRYEAILAEVEAARDLEDTLLEQIDALQLSISAVTTLFSEPDSTETDQGVAGDGNTINSAIDAIGSDQGTIVLKHNSGDATTTYTLTTSETVPANITLKFENGAILDGAGTLTINKPENIITNKFAQIFGSSVTIAFTGSGIVYPEWWGAVGDGITDDGPALSKAISCSSGFPIKLSSGPYYIDSNVPLKSDTTIIGIHKNKSVLKRGISLSSSAMFSNPSATEVSNITFKDFTIDNEDIAQNVLSLDYGSISDIHIENVIFTDLNTACLSFSPTATSFVTGLNIISCEFIGNGYQSNTSSIYIENSRNININYSKFINCHAISINQSSSLPAGTIVGTINISDNTFSGIGNTNILIRSNDDIILEGVIVNDNIVSNAGMSLGKGFVGVGTFPVGSTTPISRKMIVSGNVITGFGLAGAGFAIECGGVYGDKNDIIVTNNVIDGNDSSGNWQGGIGINAAFDTTVTTNSGLFISGNTIRNVGYSGISFESVRDGAVIFGNFIDASCQNGGGGLISYHGGIALSKVENSTVIGNVVRNTGTAAVNRPGIILRDSDRNIIGLNQCSDDQGTPTQSWGIFSDNVGVNNLYVGNHGYGNIDGLEQTGGLSDYAGDNIRAFAKIINNVSPGCADATTAGYAKFTNNITYVFKNFVKSKNSADDFWDLTGVSTGAGEYKKVLLGLSIGNAALISEGPIASGQASAIIPGKPETMAIALGFVEIGQNYSGGDLSTNTFYDLWQW